MRTDCLTETVKWCYFRYPHAVLRSGGSAVRVRSTEYEYLLRFFAGSRLGRPQSFPLPWTSPHLQLRHGGLPHSPSLTGSRSASWRLIDWPNGEFSYAGASARMYIQTGTPLETLSLATSEKDGLPISGQANHGGKLLCASSRIVSFIYSGVAGNRYQNCFCLSHPFVFPIWGCQFDLTRFRAVSRSFNFT